MSALLGVFILGILSGWLMEWIFVRLFVPNPKKKVELALQASRKEVENLQKQNRELQASLQAVAVPVAAPVVEPEPIVEVEAPAVEAVMEPESVTEVEVPKDDLTRLGGIGPKLAEAMNAAGITAYAQIAAMSSDELSKSLSESGARYNKTTAETWAAQAKLAAEGDWKGLKDFQARNKGA